MRLANQSEPRLEAWTRIASTFASSSPTIAIIPPGRSTAARAMIRPRSWTSSRAVSQGIAPDAASAQNSPRLCPAITFTCSMP